MRATRTASICVLLLAQPATARAQRTCSVQGPPYGPTHYVGNAGHTFEYWSHSGTVNMDNFFQVGIRNLGGAPLTIDWEAANYFRRGIASGKDAPGQCRSDRNPVNVASGVIRYGPNANFSGPVATLFKPSDLGASNAAEPAEFVVEWESILESGEAYLTAIAVQVSPLEQNSIQYSVTNNGRPVEIEWSQVLTQAVLTAAQRQSDALVRGGRLFLRPADSIIFSVADLTQSPAVVMGPLSVYIPDGPLIYRDVHPGLVFTLRNVGR